MPNTGHMERSVAPRYRLTPLRNGSVLDCLIITLMRWDLCDCQLRYLSRIDEMTRRRIPDLEW